MTPGGIEWSEQLIVWINKQFLSEQVIRGFQYDLSHSTPNYLVIDGLFNVGVLDNVYSALQQETQWRQQRHTYSDLYVNDSVWNDTPDDERFVQRDEWLSAKRENSESLEFVTQFLTFLRSDSFMHFLSSIVEIKLSDVNVESPSVNTKLFRLGANDFIHQHHDGTENREVCLLLYLNKNMTANMGGELCFNAKDKNKPIEIAPLYNRCILFNPASKGAEHWVKPTSCGGEFRYNVTSWYWSE